MQTICTILHARRNYRPILSPLRGRVRSHRVGDRDRDCLSIAREMFASSSSSSSSSSHLHHQRGTHHRDAKNLKLKFIVMGFVFLVPTVYTIRYQCFEESGNVLLPSFGEDVPNDARLPHAVARRASWARLAAERRQPPCRVNWTPFWT